MLKARFRLRKDKAGPLRQAQGRLSATLKYASFRMTALGADRKKGKFRSSDPEEGLADWEVADDLLVGGIGIQGLPEIDVSVFVKGNAGKEQAG